MPGISVIIPTHDRPQLLPGAIESARAAGSDIEIIVVDDASVDETASVCRALTGIKYVRLDRNQSAAGARNVGLMISEAEFVSFLDDDDLRLPNSLDAQRDLLVQNTEAAFVCGGIAIANQDYQLTGEVVAPRYPSGDVFWQIMELDFPVMGLSSLIRKESLLHVGLLRRHLIGIDDWDIFTRLAEIYPAVVTTEAVGVYRYPTRHSGQGSSARAAQLRRVFRHQLELLKLPRAQSASGKQRRMVRRRLRVRIADTSLWNAAQRLPYGDFDQVSENILLAMQLSPTRAISSRGPRRILDAFAAKRRTAIN
jgi:glycosyltransferase involved in cell wall biosynthesis